MGSLTEKHYIIRKIEKIRDGNVLFLKAEAMGPFCSMSPRALVKNFNFHDNNKDQRRKEKPCLIPFSVIEKSFRFTINRNIIKRINDAGP